MFNKLLQKATSPQPHHSPKEGSLTRKDLDPRVTVHYGIPSTASVLAFDPVQRLLPVGTLDGRIKVIGSDNIEGLFVSPKQLPFKHLEFLRNQGFLVSVSNENEIQVWDLELRRINSTFRWESNITAFSVIHSTSYMYLGDEYGMVSVLKYDAEEGKLTQLPYYVPADVIAEGAGISSSNQSSVFGGLPQPCSQGKRQGKYYLEVSLILIIFNAMSLILVISLPEVSLVSFFLRKCCTGLKGIWIRYWDLANVLREAYKVIVPELWFFVLFNTLKEFSFCRLLIAYDNGLIVLWNVSNDKVVLTVNKKREISTLCCASTDGSVLAVGYVDGDIMFWNLPTDASTKDQKAENSSTNVVKLQLSSANRRLPVIVLHWSADRSHNGGQLFVYGGDGIGSEEVLTSWRDGKLWHFAICIVKSRKLDVYDDSCLSSLMSRKEKWTSASSLQYPMVIPTIEPYMTVGKLGLVYRDGKFSRDLSKEVSAAKVQASHKQNMGCNLAGFKTASASAPVSALEFCSSTLSLAIGNACGMVRVKSFHEFNETSLTFMTEAGKEVHVLPQGDGPQCMAMFSFLNSPIGNLQFADFGGRLAVGFQCGQVAMLDISTLLFLTDNKSDSSFPVRSLAVKSFSDTNSIANSTKDPKGVFGA
ncbi:hypothetical protein EZV62_025980 [Acer yangbiense]|uniref:Uncharacterized protein n=1 Tax=Acer yangbiense TaxID=1000413 RepID=A0A5C7H033_9ROSI|nr:hypothetical protein EZV62_025980 [Acer yangbiense]